MEKVMKAGFVIPATFRQLLKWRDKTGKHQEIRFYPFVPKLHLKMHPLSPTARRANYRMFNYVGIDRLPHFVVYKKCAVGYRGTEYYGALSGASSSLVEKHAKCLNARA